MAPRESNNRGERGSTKLPEGTIGDAGGAEAEMMRDIMLILMMGGSNDSTVYKTCKLQENNTDQRRGCAGHNYWILQW